MKHKNTILKIFSIAMLILILFPVFYSTVDSIYKYSVKKNVETTESSTNN